MQFATSFSYVTDESGGGSWQNKDIEETHRYLTMNHETVLLGGSPYEILPAAYAAELGIPADAHSLMAALRGCTSDQIRLRVASVLGVAVRHPTAPAEAGILRDCLLGLTAFDEPDPWYMVKAMYSALSAKNTHKHTS